MALDVEGANVLAGVERGLTVTLIATPRAELRTCKVDEPASIVVRRRALQPFDFVPVRDGRSIVGLFDRQHYVMSEDLPRQCTRDLMYPLSEQNLISAEASVLTFVTAVDEQPCRLVVSGNGISGIVTFADLQRLPVRPVLFVLVAHLELLMTESIRLAYDGDNWLRRLPGERGRTVLRNWRRQRQAGVELDKLLITSLADKASVLAATDKLGPLRQAFGLDFECIRRLRNKLAHADDYATTRDAAFETARTARRIQDMLGQLKQFCDSRVRVRAEMTRRKRLIEVALPLEAINEESARRKQKSPKGYPTAIHKWWAQVPIASCRAVLFGQLVDDPSSWSRYFPTEEAQGAERKRLHDFIAELVKWENSNKEAILNKARWYIARSVAWRRGEEPPDEDNSDAVRCYVLDHAPAVYDPFCGSGSIPLEAQRLGLRAFGSDLNPVAVMISKALVEFPPKFASLPPINPDARKKLVEGGMWNAKGAHGLAEDVRYYSRWMRSEAYKRVGHLYPKVGLEDGSEATVVAWLWVRTVRSPNPAAKGAMVPLLSSFLLSTKEGRQAWVEPVVDASAPDGYRFETRTGALSKTEQAQLHQGTITRQGGRCLLTNVPIQFTHIRAEGKAGRMGVRLMAIVAKDDRGRIYLPPDERHVGTAGKAKPFWNPDQMLPNNPRDFKTPNYGMRTFADLFTPRQLVALATFSDLVLEVRAKALDDAKAADVALDSTPLADGGTGAQAYADVIGFYLGIVLSRLVNFNTSQCRWLTKDQAIAMGLGQQAVPMVWDFAEGNPFGESSSEVNQCAKNIADCIETVTPTVPAYVEVLPAQSALNDVSEAIICTDPPYYDNVGYADLSDFFYVWLRRSLREVFPDHFGTILVPKTEELVATPYRFNRSKDKAEDFFLLGMTEAIGKMAKACAEEIPVPIYYAYKQTEIEKEGILSTGWATFLEAVGRAGFQIDGTWPLRTQNAGRLIARGSNALASAIVLSCRKRPRDAPSVTRGEFLRALRAELPAALRTLQESAIAPVDMAQASIGPGMAVFSRYREVLEADDAPMSMREALRIINAELDAYLTEQEGDYDSWTRFAVTWFHQHGFEPGLFGDAETLAKARDVSVDGVREAGIIERKAGRVWLLRRTDLPNDYMPFMDSRQTVWEGCQHLIKRLDGPGTEHAAARLAKQLGYQADMARDLAYRLYQICERNKWAEEARAYNGLIESWREIIKIRDTLPDETTTGPAQAELGV